MLGSTNSRVKRVLVLPMKPSSDTRLGVFEDSSHVVFKLFHNETANRPHVSFAFKKDRVFTGEDGREETESTNCTPIACKECYLGGAPQDGFSYSNMFDYRNSQLWLWDRLVTPSSAFLIYRMSTQEISVGIFESDSPGETAGRKSSEETYSSKILAKCKMEDENLTERRKISLSGGEVRRGRYSVFK